MIQKTLKQPVDIDGYIRGFPPATQALLRQFRSVIRTCAPGAEELISYGMPGFRQHGRLLVWFAGYKGHIGFYPKSLAIEMFQDELKGYKTSKGAIQFPLTAPLPVALIEKIVRLRVAEELGRATTAKAKTTAKKKPAKKKPAKKKASQKSASKKSASKKTAKKKASKKTASKTP